MTIATDRRTPLLHWHWGASTVSCPGRHSPVISPSTSDAVASSWTRWRPRPRITLTTSAIDAAERLVTNSCRWRETPDGVWDTDCGHAFAFTEGGPQDNGIGYCGYCGRP